MTSSTKVEACCCTCGLRSANLILGCVYMITSCVVSTVCYTIKPSELELISDHRRNGLKIIYAVAGTMSLIQMLVAMPLVYKIYKDKTSLLRLWTIYVWTSFNILCTAAILVVLIRFTAEQAVSIIVLGLGVIAGTFFYFLVQAIKENATFDYRNMDPHES